MKKNFVFVLGLMLLALVTVFTGVASADELYHFELSEGGTITDESDYWYLSLSAPKVSGMSDADAQEELNKYFLDYLVFLTEEYEDDKAYFLDHFEGDEMPHFGIEYSYDKTAETEDYFVFKTMNFYAAGSSMTVNEYWTLDKHTGELAELSDLADSVRLTEIRDMILEAMKLENENLGEEAFWTDEDVFNTAFSYIEEYHHWYVNEKGNLVITFDKYEIAPGAFGEVQFEIVDDKAVLVRDPKYSFDLYAGDTVDISDENWYLKITLPKVGGLADKLEETEMNDHFAADAAAVQEEFETAVASAKESTAEGDGPHFGYEYSYEILSDTDNFFSFKTITYFVGGSSMTSNEFWTLDKNTGKQVRWEDVVPDNSYQAIYDQILTAMEAANESGEGMYFTDGDTLKNAILRVPASRHWYLNADEQLVIAFDKYEVAVGATGTPEFVIEF